MESRLTEYDLRQLDQRISVRYALEPFKLSETRKYVNHRMCISINSDIKDTTYKFTTFAIYLVHWYSRGIPRRINQICDRALLASFNTGKRRIGLFTILHSAREIIGRKNSGNYQPARRWLFVRIATSLTFFGIALYMGLDLYQDKINKKNEALSVSFEGYRSEHDLNEKKLESYQQKISCIT